MNILAISHNYPHKDDVTCGVFAARQFQKMNQLGSDVHVLVPLAYAPSWVSRFERYKLFRTRSLIQYPGIEAEAFRYLHPPGKLGLLADGLSAALAVRKRILQVHQEKPFDVIFARGFWLEADIGIRLSRLIGVPVVAVGIGSDVNVAPELGKAFQRKFQWIANTVDLAMATGKSVAGKISAVTNKETPVISGLVNLEMFKPVSNKQPLRKAYNMPLDKTILLFVGHLIETKGLDELIEAFRLLKKQHRDVYLIICGEGTEKETINKAIRKYNLAQDVYLAGTIMPEKINQWYQMSDVFVFPSYLEGMPNVVMEAMGCGLPVVASAVGGLPEAVSDCKGVYLIEPRNVQALYSTVSRIITTESKRKEMSEASRQKAVELFDITKRVNQVLSIMQNRLHIGGHSLV